MLKEIPLKLKGVSKIRSVSLGLNLGYPSLIVSVVISTVLRVFYYRVQNTYEKFVVVFGLVMEAVWSSLVITLRVLQMSYGLVISI